MLHHGPAGLHLHRAQSGVASARTTATNEIAAVGLTPLLIGHSTTATYRGKRRIFTGIEGQRTMENSKSEGWSTEILTRHG
jgi:hypothetical protein